MTRTDDKKYWIERAKIADLLIIHKLFRPLQSRPTLPKKNHRGGETGQTKNLSRMGQKHQFLWSISTKREADILGQHHQGRITFNKKIRQTHWDH